MMKKDLLHRSGPACFGPHIRVDMTIGRLDSEK